MFRIRHAAKLAGINPTLLRAWERRYHIVAPQRTASGYRVYTETDVQLLQAAARMVAAGHTISEVARLPAAQLLENAAAVGVTPPSTRDSATAGAVAASPAAVASIDLAIAGALRAIEAFDRQAFEAALFSASTVGGLGPVALCDQVLLPILRGIGDEWEAGRLTVAAEHFGSGLCRAKILQCLEFVARTATGARVVCACPEGELHEGGLLAFAVHAAASGWQVIYLGPHTPFDQAMATAVSIEAALVAISLTIPRTSENLEAILAVADKARRTRPSMRILAGGHEALVQRVRLQEVGIDVADQIVVALPSSQSSSEKVRSALKQS